MTLSARRPASRPRLALSPFARKAVLTVHIVVAVGLLGDSAGYLAVAIRGATTTDPASAEASYETLRMFSYVVRHPAQLRRVCSPGYLLGLGSRWGVFRYPWVTTKLFLIVSVIAVGALVLDGAMEAGLAGNSGAEPRLIAGAAYDVAALTVATVLAVFKPGGRWSPRSGTRQVAGDGD